MLLRIKYIFLTDKARGYGKRFCLDQTLPLWSRYNGVDGNLNIKDSCNRINALRKAYLLKCAKLKKIYETADSEITYTKYCLFKKLLLKKLLEEYNAVRDLLERINILNDVTTIPARAGLALGDVLKILNKIEQIYNEEDLNK